MNFRRRTLGGGGDVVVQAGDAVVAGMPKASISGFTGRPSCGRGPVASEISKAEPAAESDPRPAGAGTRPNRSAQRAEPERKIDIQESTRQKLGAPGPLQP